MATTAHRRECGFEAADEAKDGAGSAATPSPCARDTIVTRK
jgi:hypothetical protein